MSAPRLLIVGLGLVALTVAVLQTAVVPVLGVIAEQLHASPVAVSWAVTGNLLAAAASTPLLGRFADLYNKKRVLLGVLAVVLIGSILAATTSSLALLIAARVLQGVSFALYPICVAILREEVAEDAVGGALAILSGTLGFGGGMGLVVTGLLMNGDAGYHRVFWLTAGFTAVIMVLAVIVIPSRAAESEGSIDWLGAGGLALGLSGVLLAITQGNTWGWAAPATIAVAVAGVLVLVGWWWWERRRPYPLVSIAMLTRRAVMLTNLATILVGTGLYFGFLGVTQFVQTDRAIAGYGFNASVLYASLVFLLPGALAGFVTATLSGRFIDRYGARPVLMIGAVTGVVGFAALSVAHDLVWQVIATNILINAYISLAYGALPALVVSEVDSGETGVATGMNAIARTVGSAIAAAIVAVLLSHPTPATGLPPERSFIIVFIAGAGTAAVATLLIALTRGRKRSATTVDSRAMIHEWG
ncbi:MFS transporter [Mycolicibacterium sp. F2034L]|uniref:MFS transporter n=1 Tax=Mycolicibacterium sp. F2034L TaxID=2926422 RepID=UPI001FF64A19|nr:MFS transporter [Mycolicibacterium sp. F2034L]MCK0174265.1 MFS transporter [Mycolicibacterium sp. F2034L]